MRKKKLGKHTESQTPLDHGAAGALTLHLAALSLLVFLGLVVYFNSLSNGFVYDDYGTVVENRYISQPGRLLKAIFSPSYYKFAGLEASYRPVSTLSYFLIYSVAGLNPFYYHLANLILHILNAILVYWLAYIILQHRLRALMAGLLFACHPVLSEAVNSISYNDDLLTAFFFLLSLIVYCRIRTEKLVLNIGPYLGALLLYFLGLLSKEMVITLPVMVVLYDLLLRDAGRPVSSLMQRINILKSRIHFYAGFMIISLLYLWLRFFLLYNPRETLKASAGSLSERIIFLPGHLLNFIRLTLWPANLNADYVYAYPASVLDIRNLIGALVVMAMAGAAWWLYRFSKECCFAIGWFLFTLFPVYNLVEIYHPLAERYLYLPIIGFCLAVPLALQAAVRRRWSKPATVNWLTLVPLVLIVGLYSAGTMARNRVWQSNFALWSQTVQTSPNSLVARGGLGMAYLNRGMLDEAAEQFEITIKLYPEHHKGYYNLGLVYHKKGDLKKALAYFNQSVRLNPASSRAHFNLATLYLQQRKWDSAIRHYRKVNQLDPEIPLAHYNLAMAYAMQGKLKSAVAEWQQVLKLDPQNTMARDNIKKAQKMLGQTTGQKSQ